MDLTYHLSDGSGQRNLCLGLVKESGSVKPHSQGRDGSVQGIFVVKDRSRQEELGCFKAV